MSAVTRARSTGSDRAGAPGRGVRRHPARSGKARRHAFEEILDVALVARLYAPTRRSGRSRRCPPSRTRRRPSRGRTSPMGGMKDSGLGRRHGATGILKYTEPQTVSVQRLMPIAPPPAGRTAAVGAADDPWVEGAEQDPRGPVTKRSAATSAGLSKLIPTMAPLSDASPIRVALIDDDSGLLTVLERRLGALRWEIEVLAFPPDAGHAGRVAAARADRQPPADRARVHRAGGRGASGAGPARLQRARDRCPSASRACAPGPTTGSPSRATPRSCWRGSRPCCAAAGPASCPWRRRRSRPASSRSGPTATTPTSGEQGASLSRKEFELLRQLAAADGRVLEREDIYQRVWGYTMARGDRSVDVFVRKLRQKLELISPGWRYVHTHFGVGYRFAPEPADEPSGSSSRRRRVRLAADRSPASEAFAAVR